jgi:hypothetical protein
VVGIAAVKRPFLGHCHRILELISQNRKEDLDFLERVLLNYIE